MQLVSFGEALAQTGIDQAQDGDMVVTRMVNGAPVNSLLSVVRDTAMNDAEDTYLAGGVFAPGSVTRSRGRSQENLISVMWLQIDCDLKNYLQLDQSILHAMSDGELLTLAGGLRSDLEECMRSLSVRLHRIDYTGYGICGYVYLTGVTKDHVQLARESHRLLVAAINGTFGYQLADPQVIDAGTRITRIPGSYNRKNPNAPRLVKTLWMDSFNPVTTDELNFWPRRLASSVPTSVQAAPIEPRELPESIFEEIIQAIAPHWTLGQKHILALSLAGTLAKSGVPESQAHQIVDRLSTEDEKPWDRRKCVENTYRRIGSGLDTRGFHGLQALLPDTVVTYVTQRLDQVRQATSVRTNAERFTGIHDVADIPAPTEPERVETITVTPVPDICYRGWVGEYVSMMLPLTEAPEQFHLASGLGLIGASMGRRVSLNYISKPLYANLYVMLVGIAGKTRKDRAIGFALDTPRYQDGRNWHNPSFQILTDVGSPQGLMERLKDHPNIWLYITEYERLSQNAHRQSTSGIFPLLTNAWDTPAKLENVTKGSAIEANFPYLSVIAAVQPKILEKEMTPADISSGYASRWMFIPGSPGSPKPLPPNINEPAAHQLYGKLLKTLTGYDGAKLELTSDAVTRWFDWYGHDAERPLEGDDEESMQSRLGTHVMKLALIYAATERARAVDVQHLESGIAMVEWCWSHTQQLMRTWGVPVFNQIEERITKVLKERGAMKRRNLHQLCRGRHYGAREFAQVLEAMQRNGTIEMDVEGLLSYAN